MLTLLIAALILATLVGTIGVIGIGGLAMELSKVLLFCAIVLMLISALVGVARGKMRA